MAATAASLIRLCGGGGGGGAGSGGGGGAGSGGAIGRSHAPLVRSLRPSTSEKRKSAVELLQETKAFYVKSDSVLDRHQQLPHSDHLQVSPDWSPLCSLKLCGSPPPSSTMIGPPLPPPASLPPASLPLPLPLPLPLSPPPSPENSDLCVGAEPMPPAPPGFQHSSDSGPVSPPRCTPHSAPPPLPPKSPRLTASATTWAQRRSTFSSQQHSDRLQAKLRRLIGADSKEDILRDRDIDEDPLRRRLDQDDARTVAGSRVTWRYGRSNSQTHHDDRYQNERCPSNVACRGDRGGGSRSYSLHKSLPDLHSSPAHSVRSARSSARSSAQRRLTTSSWSSDNSSARDSHSHSISRSSSSSRSGPSGDLDAGLMGCNGIPSHSSSSHRGRLSLGSTPPHYMGDCVSVVSSGGRTHCSAHSARSQPQGSAAMDVRASPQGELRRGGSSGSSSGARTHRSQPEGLLRRGSMSRKCPEMLVRQGSEGSSAEVTGFGWRSGSTRSRQRRRRNHNQYRALRSHSSSVEIDTASPERVVSPPQTSVAELCWAFETRRPILRSKSDISHRYTRGGLAPPSVQSSPPRPDPQQLENFFDHLGLESDEYQYMSGRQSQSSSSPVYFSSVSSIDSATAPWGPHWSSHSVSGGAALGVGGPAAATGGSGHSGKLPEQPSIVERNARIIKWLCNCRKAHMSYMRTGS